VADPEQRTSSFAASSKSVHVNDRIRLKGRFRPIDTAVAPDSSPESRTPKPQRVAIQFRALGAEHWRSARRTRTSVEGRFSERIAVRRSGRFRAVSADGRRTKPKKIRVRSVTRARVSRSTKVGRAVRIRGRVAPGGTRRRVTVKISGERIRTRTSKSGGFSVRWKPLHASVATARVRAAGNLIAAGSRTKAGKVHVFRPAAASYYGPGLYGNGVACGGTLKPGTIGVAHKSLPCGTRLTIRYHGRQARAKVIDRGPYVAGREFDLTEALRSKLGFGGVGTILVDR
jgi:peptidoglycan lytic transglycosylase